MYPKRLKKKIEDAFIVLILNDSKSKKGNFQQSDENFSLKKGQFIHTTKLIYTFHNHTTKS